MIEDGRKGYEFNNRNVKDSRAFKIVEHQGKRAALFKLTLDMKGAEGDWFRNNKPGNAQRFEFGETKENAQKFNQEIWTRMSIFIPKGKTLTFGEISSNTKYKIDHRFKAFQKIKKFL